MSEASSATSKGVPTVVVVMIVGGVLALVAWFVVSAPERQKQQEERDERARERAKQEAHEQALAGCREIESRISIQRQQGADVVELNKAEAELRDCLRQHDPARLWRADLVAAQAAQQQIVAEWSHLLSTDYSDTMKRGSTRATWLRIADGAIRSLRTAMAGAKSSADLDEIREVALTIARESWTRVARFDASPDGASGGAARYLGSVEASREEKAGDELTRIIAPIIGAVPEATGQVKLDHAKYGARPVERFGGPVLTDGPPGRNSALQWERLGIEGVNGEAAYRMHVIKAGGHDRYAQWVRAGQGSVLDALEARRAELAEARRAAVVKAMEVLPGALAGRMPIRFV